MAISKDELLLLFQSNPTIEKEFLIRMHIAGVVELTNLESPSLASASIKTDYAPEKPIDVDSWIDDWRQLWPDVMQSHKHLLLSKGKAGVRGRCLKLMTEFCKRYNYTREEIFTATTMWLNDLKLLGTNGRLAKNPEGFLAPHDMSRLANKDFESGELYDYLTNKLHNSEENNFNVMYNDL